MQVLAPLFSKFFLNKIRLVADIFRKFNVRFDMCNGFPAPRCSHHALNLLQDAQAELDEAVSLEATELAEIKVRNAEKVYYMTPAGFRYLEERIKTETNNLIRDRLYAQLYEGKKDRKDAILAAKRIARENKIRLEHTKEMRELSIPSWSIAGQLNMEYLQSKGLTFDHSVDVTKKAFFINYGAEGEERTMLSISNKHYLALGDISKTGNTYNEPHDLAPIMNAFADRGSNAVIEFEELTYKQKNIVWEYITNMLEAQGVGELIVCNPSVGQTRVIELAQLKDNFTLTLYTPEAKKSGSDNLPAKELPDFVKAFGKDRMRAEPTKVGNKFIVETFMEIENPDDLYVGENYYLSHLKENFYVVKRLGKVSNYKLRCMLKLN
mgnify:CR=1 FL=1